MYTLTLKAYNKMRISYSSSERRSIFNASRWSKLFSNVTYCFTPCTSVHSPSVELDMIRLQSDPFRGSQGLAAQQQIVPLFQLFPLKHVRAWSVCMQHQHRLNYGITMLFIHTGTNRSQQPYY